MNAHVTEVLNKLHVVVKNNKLNNNLLFATYQVIIQKELDKLLEYPERKEVLKSDANDMNGVRYDLSIVALKDKEVTLTCFLVADNNTDFWAKYNAFFAEVTKTGYQLLYIDDYDKTFEIFYKKSGAFELKSMRLKDVPVVAAKFELTLGVK